MRQLLIFSVSILMLGACSPVLTRSEYLWGAYASRGDELLVVRRTSQFETDPLPVPERTAPHLISEDHEVVSIDLRGHEGRRVLAQVEKRPADMAIPADYDYLVVPAEGVVQLWGMRALGQKLQEAGSIACKGHVQYDDQDSTVLYYRCDEEGLVYRFENPGERACVMRIGPTAGMEPLTTAEYRFSSVAGTGRTYLAVGWGLLYEIEHCRQETPRQIDRFTAPEQSNWGAAPSKALTWQEAQALPYRLIGMSDALRIYQVGIHGTDAEIVAVAEGRVVHRAALPAALRANEEWLPGRYLPRSGRIIWNVMDPSERVSALHVFDLKSGAFSLVELPLP